MPLYEYKCVKCGHLFEKIEGFDASMKKKCPKCGANAERQVSASAIQFKGSGWYVTDYAAKKSGSGESGSEAAKTSEKSASEKSGDSKDKSAESKDKSTDSKDKPATSSDKSSDKSDKTSKKKK